MKPQNHVYVWRNNQVEIILIDGTMEFQAIDCLLVDSRYPESISGKYGKYYIDSENNTQWEHIPLAKFPEEFKAHLFLLGVT